MEQEDQSHEGRWLGVFPAVNSVHLWIISYLSMGRFNIDL